MINKPLLIHIGYHKTATTWMQKILFQPIHGYRPILDQYIVFDHFIKPHGLTFQPAPARKLLLSDLESVLDGETGVISAETLSGHPFFGGRESDAYAQRLALIAPEARILISIRNQMTILPSVYMQYLLRGGTMNYKQFFEGDVDVQYPSFSTEHFKYDRLIHLYQELFGKERVFVLSNESLRNSTEATLRKLANFSGNNLYLELKTRPSISIGQSYPEYAVPILRRINHVQTGTLNPRPIVSLGRTPKGMYKISGYVLKQPIFSRLLNSYKPVSTYVRNRFSDDFVESNRLLAGIFGRDLDLTDYPGIDK